MQALTGYNHLAVPVECERKKEVEQANVFAVHGLSRSCQFQPLVFAMWQNTRGNDTLKDKLLQSGVKYAAELGVARFV